MSGIEFTIAIVAIGCASGLINNFMKFYFSRKSSRAQQPDSEELDRLYLRAEELSERIYKLENILDKDLPGWRNHA